MSEAAAASIWNELLAGQWVVIERHDEIAQRTLVLRRATEAEQQTRAFTAVEREVVAMAMRAWSLKMIGAELGLSTSRVAEALGRARNKLGAPTHADLLRMVGSFGLVAADNPATPRPTETAVESPSAREKSLHRRQFAGRRSHIRSSPDL